MTLRASCDDPVVSINDYLYRDICNYEGWVRLSSGIVKICDLIGRIPGITFRIAFPTSRFDAECDPWCDHPVHCSVFDIVLGYNTSKNRSIGEIDLGGRWQLRNPCVLRTWALFRDSSNHSLSSHGCASVF